MKQLIILCTALVLLLNSCEFTTGSGKIITQNRQVDNFTGIAASNAIEVEVKIGTAANIEVEADDNIIKYIKTSVSNGILKIETEGLHGINNAHMKVYVTATQLKSIKASSSANVKVLNVITYNGKLSFDASSSGDIEAEVDAPEVEAEASSSASVTLSGKTRRYDAKASSSGDINSADLLSETTTVSANSSGSAEVYASVSLDAHASSSGDIVYHGAASVKQSTNSSGSVEKAEH